MKAFRDNCNSPLHTLAFKNVLLLSINLFVLFPFFDLRLFTSALPSSVNYREKKKLINRFAKIKGFLGLGFDKRFMNGLDRNSNQIQLPEHPNLWSDSYEIGLLYLIKISNKTLSSVMWKCVFYKHCTYGRLKYRCFWERMTNLECFHQSIP